MIEMIKVSDLKPHPMNETYFDDIEGEKWEEFLGSVQRQGVMTPLVLTEDHTIVSGHQRYRACLALNITEVPCRVLPALKTDDDVILAMIESNIRQRGIVNSPSVKLGRMLIAMERILGAGDRDEGGKPSAKAPTRKDIREHLGIDRNVAKCSKAIAKMPTEVQTLIESEAIGPRSAYDYISKLTPDEQVELAMKLDPVQRYTQSEIKKAIERFFPKADQIDEMQKRLAEYQQNDSELDLREKLRATEAKERQTFEDLQTERRLRKKENAEHEKHMEAMEQLLNDNDNSGAADEIARLTEERDQYMKDADVAQANADIDLVVSLIGAMSGSFAQVANDPRPLVGDAAGTAYLMVGQLEEKLEQIRERLVAGDPTLGGV